jgi:arylsulfatase A-like enzyme
VGKWHLGNADTAYWPQQRGFDSFYGHLNGGIGYFDHIFSGGVDWQKDGVTLREQGYTTDLIRDAAIELIENRSQDDEPLFLFVSFNAIHTPIEEPDTPDKAHQGRATLLRMISSLDQAIGEILESVNQQPWGQDTIIVFASDNGGSPPKPWWVELLIPPMRDGFSSNGQLKQGKGSVFEGGIRVPAAIWWPGKIASAQAFSEVVHVADILPTLADLVGVPITKVDGRSIKDALMHNKQLPERAIVVANFDNEALIEWPWKIVREGSLPMTPDFLKSETWYLYNIESDPGELEDLQTQYPQHFARLRDALLAIPRRRSVEFTTDQAWDTFGGEETRAPWAESAQQHQGN